MNTVAIRFSGVCTEVQMRPDTKSSMNVRSSSTVSRLNSKSVFSAVLVFSVGSSLDISHQPLHLLKHLQPSGGAVFRGPGLLGFFDEGENLSRLTRIVSVFDLCLALPGVEGPDDDVESLAASVPPRDLRVLVPLLEVTRHHLTCFTLRPRRFMIAMHAMHASNSGSSFFEPLYRAMHSPEQKCVFSSHFFVL